VFPFSLEGRLDPPSFFLFCTDYVDKDTTFRLSSFSVARPQRIFSPFFPLQSHQEKPRVMVEKLLFLYYALGQSPLSLCPAQKADETQRA